jgi:hypothetical protein
MDSIKKLTTSSLLQSFSLKAPFFIIHFNLKTLLLS